MVIFYIVIILCTTMFIVSCFLFNSGQCGDDETYDLSEIGKIDLIENSGKLVIRINNEVFDEYYPANWYTSNELFGYEISNNELSLFHGQNYFNSFCYRCHGNTSFTNADSLNNFIDSLSRFSEVYKKYTSKLILGKEYYRSVSEKHRDYFLIDEDLRNKLNDYLRCLNDKKGDCYLGPVL